MSVIEVMVPNDAIPNLRESKPQWLVADLRSDHAGETGAIWIYQGILSTTNEDAVKEFAQHHLATELRHLEEIEKLLDKKDRSVLIPLWKIFRVFNRRLTCADWTKSCLCNNFCC